MGSNSYLAMKLITVMQEKNITVKALAKKTGLAHGTISNIRNGKNHYTWQLQLICDELNIPVGYLIDDSVTAAQLRAIQSILSITDEPFLSALTVLINASKKIMANNQFLFDTLHILDNNPINKIIVSEGYIYELCNIKTNSSKC